MSTLRLRTTRARTLMVAALATSPAAAQKSLIDYFQPTPIVGNLSSSAWGTAAVGPRDQSNGLEDKTMAQYSYWDGQILRGADGKYHMFASRWAQSRGMSGWSTSIAVHAVSDALYGPYVDKGAAYTDSNGKGHNVTAALLPDGKYAIIASDTRPGAIFSSSSIDGPFAYQGDITVNANGYDASGTTKNLSLTFLADNSFLMATRFGAIMTSSTTLLGPWLVRGPRVFTTPSGYPSAREDPVIWCSGGQFHLVYNYYDYRKARHMVSADGITGWKDVGLAYDPTTNFVRYTDGTVNHWYKMERPGVYMEGGHVKAFTFAVIDVDKASDLGNDTHGTKVIVVPFDGVTFDAETGVSGSKACSAYTMNSGVPSTTGTGGTTGMGGSMATGGTSSGGSANSGGRSAAGGSTNVGGATSSGGRASTGGVPSGGSKATGGSSSGAGSVGGSRASGGASSNGGALSSGGITNMGGAATTPVTVGGASIAAGGMAIGMGGNTASSGSTSIAPSNGGATTTGASTGGLTNAVGGAEGTALPLDGGANDSGCSCRITGNGSNRGGSFALLSMLGALGLALGRRRRSPSGEANQ